MKGNIHSDMYLKLVPYIPIKVNRRGFRPEVVHIHTDPGNCSFEKYVGYPADIRGITAKEYLCHKCFTEVHKIFF